MTDNEVTHPRLAVAAEDVPCTSPIDWQPFWSGVTSPQFLPHLRTE